MTLLERLHASIGTGSIPEDILALDSQITDCNSVIFDVAHDFAGCIPGCHEILRRQGLMRTAHCLDPSEVLSPGQAAEIDRIYLQADLTAIAPGPLAPRLDLRLRRIAKRESRAQASSYRFSADSIGAGMTEGESAESIREFLAGISLTGIPQPLDYLIESTAARHGRSLADAGQEFGNQP